MIGKIAKIFGVLEKIFPLVFRYCSKPTIEIAVKGSGCAQGPSHIFGNVYYRWNRKLTFYSTKIVKGIKLLNALPQPWKLGGEIPVILTDEAKVVIQISAEVDDRPEKLIADFGVKDENHKLFDDFIFAKFLLNSLGDVHRQNHNVYQLFIYIFA